MEWKENKKKFQKKSYIIKFVVNGFKRKDKRKLFENDIVQDKKHQAQLKLCFDESKEQFVCLNVETQDQIDIPEDPYDIFKSLVFIGIDVTDRTSK